MNQIHIEQLKIMASIGCEPFEKAIKQPLFVDIEFACNVEKAAQSDALNDTIDYTAICTTIEEVASAKHYQLIETLANTLTQTLVNNFGLSQLSLRLFKPTAIKNAKSVSVSINQVS